MSEENDGEEKKNDTFSEEFEFYFSFTKPLVLDLPTEEDRALAAAWVQKLESEPQTVKEKEQRLNYLKLLLFVLQRGRLNGIFARQPPSGPLQPFPQGFSIFDMGNVILEQDDDQFYGGGDAGRIPYNMELSNNLREYVASQEIPNFGVQMYYAWSSDEPINKWSMFDEEKFPQYILEKIKQMKALKYDEKSETQIDKCQTNRKSCNFSFPDILSKNKVKSPEEIEKSQRSFLTYMGLVGRMGNLNDKCDEDPERYQRQNFLRTCSAKRKKCPGNLGAEDITEEEEFDNLAPGLGGGLNPTNRPCLCSYPPQQINCPGQQLKKRPQSSYQQMSPRGNNSDVENGQWPNSVPKYWETNRMREQCLENIVSGVPVQQRNTSTRSPSVNRRGGIDCCQEGNSGRPPNQGELCVCSSPPCTCPCPRATTKPPPMKLQSLGNGGRVCSNPSRTCSRLTRPDPMDGNINRNRGMGGPQPGPFNALELGAPAPGRPDTSTGGRTWGNFGGSGASRPTQPLTMHCYDNENPDLALMKAMGKNDNWMQLEKGGAKYVDTEFKNAFTRDQLITDAMQNKCTLPPRRELFDSQPQPGPSGINRMRSQNECPPSSRNSPPLSTHPLCGHSPSNQQEAFPHQQCPENFGESEACVPQMQYPSCNEGGGRINTNIQKKIQPQATGRVKNGGPFAVTNDTGRLGNLTNALQRMKQKTESHGEKCEEPGASTAPLNDPYSAFGVQNQAQTKGYPGQTGQRIRGFPSCANEHMNKNMVPECGSYQQPPQSQLQQSFTPFPNRGCGNSYNSSQSRNLMSPQLPSAAYDFTLYRLPNYQLQECDPCFEEAKSDSESSTSLEDHCQKDDNQYPGLSSTPVEFIGTMLSATDTSCETEWSPSERVPASNFTSGPRNFFSSCMENEGRNMGLTRTTPGRTPQRETCMDDSLEVNPSQYDESCDRSPVPQGSRRNRYMEQSSMACSRPARQPVSSTPIRRHREN